MVSEALSKALASVGMSEAKVNRWLGSCCCRERRERMDAMEAWARRVAAKGVAGMLEYLRRFMQ